MHTTCILFTSCTHYRLADLHHTMNVPTKPSVTGNDEGAWLGAWPSGRMVGKKGDILKLVSQSSNAVICTCIYSLISFAESAKLLM